MSHARARQAIEIKLSAWASARPIRVAYSTSEFKASAGETYLRAFLLPASTTSRYLASEALEYRGIYQISIVCPSGTPSAVHEAITDELNALLPVDSELVRGGFEGQIIEPPSPGPTIIEPTTYTVPVSLTYLGLADQ